MVEAIALEFDFPEIKRDRREGRLARVLELQRKVRAVTEKEGALIPLMLAALVLDVHRTRIDELVATDRLKRVDLDGHVFITEDSIVAFAKDERKAGRPCKVVDSAPEAWRRAQQWARQVKANKK